MFQLENSEKYISVNEWQGVTRVHIRHFFSSNGGAPGGGELMPTKKGVALTISEWQALKNYIDEIDSQITAIENVRKRINEENLWQPNAKQPKSLIPEECQYKPTASVVSQQITKIRNVTPYHRLAEPEPFDQ